MSRKISDQARERLKKELGRQKVNAAPMGRMSGPGVEERSQFADDEVTRSSYEKRTKAIMKDIDTFPKKRTPATKKGRK